MTLVFSIMALITNVHADKIEQWMDPDVTPTNVLKLTMGNRGVLKTEYDNDDMIVQAYLNFGVIIIILVLVNFLRWRQMRVEKMIDEKNVTPADFTIYVMNLPKDKNEDDIAKYFQEFNPNNVWEVAKVNLCYDIRIIVKKVRQLEKWVKIRNVAKIEAEEMAKNKNIDFEEASHKVKKYDKAVVMADKIAHEIEAIKDEVNGKDTSDYYCRNAFVIFSTQDNAATAVKQFEMFWLNRAFFFVWYKIFRCKNSKINNKYWEGERVIVERATEPGDVYWENLSVTDFERFLRQLLTYFITAC